MAMIRGDYVQQGRAAFAALVSKGVTIPEEDYPVLASPNGMAVAMSGSWQAMAWKEGFNAARVKASDDARRREAQAVNMAKPTAGEALDAARAVARNTVSPAEQRRADRIDAMTRGYIEAALWSTGGCTDPETGEDLEHLDDYEFSDAAQTKAWGICAAFYDRYTTDVNAYAGTYQPSDGSDTYECAGHDLWLTSAGHGVGFWDRGLGGLGERLSKACGYFTDFPPRDLYIGDDNLVYIDN